MAIKLIIDSAADICLKEAEELGIVMLPMIISFGSEDYLDGVDLLPKQFFEKLVEGDVFPKTSQVTPYRFLEEYEKLEKDEEAIVITISSKLSGTYNAAKMASKGFNNVYVVDSLNACIGEKLLVLHALELIKKGLSAKEIYNSLEEIKGKIKLIAMVNTLEYLRKGGRISSFTAIAGELLSIKPVVGVYEGKIKQLGKARGSKNANNLLNKIVNDTNGIDFNMPFGVVYSGLDDTLAKKYIKDSCHLWENQTDNIPIYCIGSTIGTHIGPGAIGVAFFEK